MPRRVIFFDIDGTLLNSGGAGQRAMEAAITFSLGIDLPFDGILTAGRTDRGIVREIFERHQVEDTQENRDQFRDGYLQCLPGSLNESPGLLLPGVESLLDELEASNHLLLSLLTGNYRAGANIKLRHYNLHTRFTAGGFGDDEPNRDDVARAALESVRNLVPGIRGADTMVIGDTPADIRCARAIGAVAVGVATGHYSLEELEKTEPDLLFEDFSRQDTSDRLLSAFEGRSAS
ncbi:MAG TPA: haloacid dehalogenase [Planctomycetaceae bacterium]|nr:haloacid dehalogenase [Planctomycetaceae bacterium]